MFSNASLKHRLKVLSQVEMRNASFHLDVGEGYKVQKGSDFLELFEIRASESLNFKTLNTKASITL